MINYVSTRGLGLTEGKNPKNFEDVLLEGLADDGGLYVPEFWPHINPGTLAALQSRSYIDTAFEVMREYTGDTLDSNEFYTILRETYTDGSFDHKCITPLVQIDSNIWIMEHFHGPTLAFKDVALQLLGRLFDRVLEKRGERITIIGATSGDTGSAAIEACRHCKNVDIFILHPHGRVSEVQRRQMTCVKADNVYNIALEGHFDDCQTLVKAMFGDKALRHDLNLSAVNSINWARIMAQIVYYVTSSIALGGPERRISYSVPTGNFGNIYAAYAAIQMNVPLGNLIVSTNRNDIITRFFETGEMRLGDVHASYSPSMDIQISSNFERYLFDLLDRDPQKLSSLMQKFREEKTFKLSADNMAQARSTFSAHRCDDEQTLEIIRTVYKETGYIIDPHTAVGLSGGLATKETIEGPIISLACAHPAKFPDAVEKAIGVRPPLPERMLDLYERKEYFTVIDNDFSKVAAFIKTNSRVTQKSVA